METLTPTDMPMPKPAIRRPLSTQEVADRVGLSRSKIQIDIKLGELIAVPLHCGRRRIYRIAEAEYRRYERKLTGQT